MTSPYHKTEEELIDALITKIEALDAFATGSVTFGDEKILDKSHALSPFAVVDLADQFNIRARSSDYTIILTLYVAFTTWPQSREDFRDARQAIISEFTDDSSDFATLGLDGVMISELSAITPIMAYNGSEVETAFPRYLVQQLAIQTETF